MKTGYASFCQKYSALPYLLSVLTANVAVFTTTDYLLSFFTLVGMGVAHKGVEKILPPVLMKHNIGINQGTKILRRTQFSCAALGLCVGIYTQNLVGFDNPFRPTTNGKHSIVYLLTH